MGYRRLHLPGPAGSASGRLPPARSLATAIPSPRDLNGRPGSQKGLRQWGKNRKTSGSSEHRNRCPRLTLRLHRDGRGPVARAGRGSLRDGALRNDLDSWTTASNTLGPYSTQQYLTRRRKGRRPRTWLERRDSSRTSSRQPEPLRMHMPPRTGAAGSAPR